MDISANTSVIVINEDCSGVIFSQDISGYCPPICIDDISGYCPPICMDDISGTPPIYTNDSEIVVIVIPLRDSDKNLNSASIQMKKRNEKTDNIEIQIGNYSENEDSENIDIPTNNNYSLGIRSQWRKIRSSAHTPITEHVKHKASQEGSPIVHPKPNSLPNPHPKPRSLPPPHAKPHINPSHIGHHYPYQYPHHPYHPHHRPHHPHHRPHHPYYPYPRPYPLPLYTQAVHPNPQSPTMRESPSSTNDIGFPPPPLPPSSSPVQVFMKPSTPPIPPKVIPYMLKEPQILTKHIIENHSLQPGIYKIVRPTPYRRH